MEATGKGVEMTIQRLPFLEVFKDASGGNIKTPQKYFLEEGEIPVVDQGQQTIAGYVNDRSLVCKAKPPVIVFGDHTKRIKYVDFEFAMGADGTKVLIPKIESDPKYLFYALCSLSIPDAGYSRHYKFLKEAVIPLPLLAEQKRIAAILDLADALRVKRRETIAQLDTLIQSIFLDMFGDPKINPMGWDQKHLKDITSIKAPMIDPRKAEYRKLLHYGPDRIKKDNGELLPALTAEDDQLISGKFLCSPGDILYSKIRPYLNKVALVSERCLCSADVYPVQPDERFLNREYLWVLLRSDAFLDYVAGFSRRANIPKLNRKQFFGFVAPVPPLELQRRFATIVQSIEEQKVRLRAHLAELDILFASLQTRAFKGEL